VKIFIDYYILMRFRKHILAFIICLSGLLHAESQPMHYATAESGSSAMLANGTWYKIKILRSGIYRLDYSDLVGMGLSNPSFVRVYGNGGSMLPLMNAIPRPADLIENSIYMNKGADGIFNEGDYILFYGRGPVNWTYNSSSEMFEHQTHLYTQASYYFITSGNSEGKQIGEAIPVTGIPDAESQTFDDYACHEIEKYNLLQSGRLWVGKRVDYAPFDTTYIFQDLQTSSPVKARVSVVGRSSQDRYFRVFHNSSSVAAIQVPPVILTNTTGIYANQKIAKFEFPASGDEVNVRIAYDKFLSSDEGYLDYLTLNVRRRLAQYGSVTFFRDALAAGTPGITRYTIEDCDAQSEIWDITDPYNIQKIQGNLTGSTLTFSDSSLLLKEYAVIQPAASFPKPVITPGGKDTGPIPNQNLHAYTPCQMLIVTHPEFIAAADSFAGFHRSTDQLSVSVATTEQIYNEFSSGAPDVAAIRDFARMIWMRSDSAENRLRYLLLVGDGSYNNVSQTQGNSNFILTYQSESSLNASTSYVSDDFFGFMDESEGGSETMQNYTLDLGVGRLPVKTADEAMTVYRKIRNYNTPENRKDWRNRILFAGDDEDGNIHMEQANELADWIGVHYPQMVVKKIMIDAYKQFSSSSGTRYPDVNQLLKDHFNKGLLIFNYTGHGGETGLAQERILTKEELESLTNIKNLPFFVTATCEFSRFDNLRENDGVITENTSAGECSLLNPHGGSVGLFTTTRIVYSDRNHYLNSKFYRVVFLRDENGRHYRLGDAVRMAKDSSGSNHNKLNFTLLGDPALTLAVPGYTVLTDSINGMAVNQGTDTLRAFSRVRVAGHLVDNDSIWLNDFNGTIYPSVFDKSRTLTTLANDAGEPFQFNARENILYKGKASVNQGRFAFEFLVPKDINYSFGEGFISYYAHNHVTDAQGAFSDMIIGGTDTEALTDLEGPEINLFLNDPYFRNEGITDENPVIYADIIDLSGINTTGNGIGHDITGILDDDVSHPVILNAYFESHLDDFTSGILRYPMFNLSQGIHSLRVRVWDVFNNSSESSLTFQVISGTQLSISDVYNYPNPARDYTYFTFEHNQPDEVLQVSIAIYDMSGRMVAQLNKTLTSSGFRVEPMEWDMKDSGGKPLREGIYPYRLRITNIHGTYTESYQKLVVLRQ
jgi:hypothetical protein